MTTQLTHGGNILDLVRLDIRPDSEVLRYSPETDLGQRVSFFRRAHVHQDTYLSVIRTGCKQLIVERVPNPGYFLILLPLSHPAKLTNRCPVPQRYDRGIGGFSRAICHAHGEE